MKFPVLMIFEDGSRRLFEYPESFSCERHLTVSRPTTKTVTTTEQVEDPDTGEMTEQEVTTEQVEMVDVQETDTITHPSVVWNLWTEQDWASNCPELVVRSVVDVVPNESNKRAIKRPIQDWVVDNSQATVTYDLVDLSDLEISQQLVDAKTSAKTQVTAQRYTEETGGITINGLTIRTDRESQALINGAYALARDMLSGDIPTTPIEFKGVSGWSQISPADMVSIGRAVAQHVQACFSRERERHDAIDAAQTIADVLAVAGNNS